MPIAQRHLALAACAVLLIGCTTTGPGDEQSSPPEQEPTSAVVTTTTVQSATASPSSAPSATDQPLTDEPSMTLSSRPPSSMAEPTSTASSAPTDDAGSGSVPTDLPPAVLLPDAAFDPFTGDRVDTDGVAAWALPDSCAIDPPAAAAMRGVTVGSGEFEATVGVQQVAVFPDADTAVVEADRLVAALSGCTASTETSTLYVPEPIAVGAQGAGLAIDYYGASASGSGDEALGSYLAVTRRGTAVTLVANDGGESTIGVARAEVTDRLQAAWELLCTYDSAGC